MIKKIDCISSRECINMTQYPAANQNQEKLPASTIAQDDDDDDIDEFYDITGTKELRKEADKLFREYQHLSNLPEYQILLDLKSILLDLRRELQYMELEPYSMHVICQDIIRNLFSLSPEAQDILLTDFNNSDLDFGYEPATEYLYLKFYEGDKKQSKLFMRLIAAFRSAISTFYYEFINSYFRVYGRALNYGELFQECVKLFVLIFLVPACDSLNCKLDIKRVNEFINKLFLSLEVNKYAKFRDESKSPEVDAYNDPSFIHKRLVDYLNKASVLGQKQNNIYKQIKVVDILRSLLLEIQK